MTAQLPPNLLALFGARPPIPQLTQLDRDPRQKRGPTISGIAQYAKELEASNSNEPSSPNLLETPAQRKKRVAKEKEEINDARIQSKMAEWDPHKDPNVTEDPYRTLIVARLSYDVTERRLKREFETYGPIKKVRIVVDSKTGKPRGYAFIEFEKERDMKVAFKEADGKKIDGRRCVVDVERGRTVSGWLPRRLGGGKGKTRAGGPDQNQKHSGREEGPGEGSRKISRSRSRSPSREKPKERVVERERERDRREPDRGPRERDFRDRDHRDHHRDHRDRGRDREREHRDRDYRDRDRDSRRDSRGYRDRR